jgi:hygromycin-B 7''-O-kinase
MDEYLLPPVRDWRDWGAIFTDAELWRPVVERVAAAHPALFPPPPRRVEAGFPGTCAVFIIHGADASAPPVVVKLFPPLVAGDFSKERAVYRLLGERLPEAPRLLAAGVFRDRTAWPYLILSFRPGAAWRDTAVGIPPEERLSIGRALGGLLRRVHETPVVAGRPWPPPDSWKRFVARQMAEAPVALRRRTVLPESVVAATGGLLRRTDFFAARPRLLHGDLTADHVLVSERDGAWAVAGLLDWADAEVGDPDYEWPALWFGFCGRDAAVWRAALAEYGWEGRIDRERLLAFTLLHRFGAHMIADALSEDEQRAVSDLDDLAARLFAEVE